jgi:hypothetical protein
VLLVAERVTSGTCIDSDAAKCCEELWFDKVIEAEKKRVVCIVRDNEHFELAVVHTPEMRFVFDLGADWVEARRLMLEFVKKRVPGVPLGPKWEPPAGSELARKLGSYARVSESDAKLIRELESKNGRVARESEQSQESAGVQVQGFGERPRDSKIERREGRGGGIMNTTHISTIRTRAVSCKKTIGREGPGRDKNVSKLTAGNSYVPDTSPPREKRCHTNSRSNTVKIFPHTHQQTPPSRPIGGRPLLAGTSLQSPVKVLATPELESRSRGSKSFPRSLSVARGASARREASVGLYNEAVVKFSTSAEAFELRT